MKLRVFTLRLDPTTGVFDDADMTQFLAHRGVRRRSPASGQQKSVPRWRPTQPPLETFAGA